MRSIRYSQHREPRYGFTLVEILTVVAIIAGLTAILLPVFQNARKQARSRSCLSQIRQVGMASMMYAQDHDNLFPVALNPSDPMRLDRWKLWNPEFAVSIPTLPQFHTIIGGYLRTDGLLKCPSDFGLRLLDVYPGWRLEAPSSSYETFGTSYFYHSWLAACHGRINATSDLTKVPIVLDANGAWHGAHPPNNFVAHQYLMYNVVFSDGHARLHNHEYLGKILAKDTCD